jgi:hypothetical protein
MKCNCDVDFACDEPECIKRREELEKQMYREYRLYCIKKEDGSLIDVRDLYQKK